MTKTHQLLDLLISGRPMTYPEIMAVTGWSIEQAKKIVHYMATASYITHMPLAYVITQSGVDQYQSIAKTPPETISKKTEQRRERRKRELERVRSAPFSASQKLNDGESTIQAALRTQPNSVFSLGSI